VEAVSDVTAGAGDGKAVEVSGFEGVVVAIGGAAAEAAGIADDRESAGGETDTCGAGDSRAVSLSGVVGLVAVGGESGCAAGIRLRPSFTE
jgi:hypothetical protein